MTEDGKSLLFILLFIGALWYFNQNSVAPISTQSDPAYESDEGKAPWELKRERPEPEYDRPAPVPATATSVPPAAVPTGYPWQDARQYLGQRVTICGPVVNTSFRPEANGSPTFLNIGRDYPDPERFQVVIWGENLHSFDYEADTFYQGREVCVTGEVEEYQGVAEMTAYGPDQIGVR